MDLTVVSFKECWRLPEGGWATDGGFPMQMDAITGLFDRATLLVVEVPFREGGSPLPPHAAVVTLRRPAGRNLSRKLALLASLPYYLAAIRRYTRSGEVVHTPLPGDLPLLAMLVAVLQGNRLIVRYGGSWEETSRTTRMNRVTKGLMARFAGGRRVMLVSGLGSPDRPPAPGVHWLFTTAISADEVRTVRPDLTRAAHTPLRLAYAGRLSPEKGLPVLLQALAQVKARVGDGPPPLRVTLIGEGPQRAEIERLRDRLQLGEWVSLVGQKTRPQLYELFAESDAAVLPSLTESVGKARIDAMLAGLPVLTTEVGFGRVIVGADGERGWLVPAGDVDALAQRLLALIREPVEWPLMRRRCRLFAEKFTLEGWQAEIARICAAQWQAGLQEGKLTV